MPLWKFLAAQHFVEQLTRQGGASVDVCRHALHNIPFPAVVFHELRGELDGIPFDAMDAGNAQFFAARQQVVQAVAGFVEKGNHVIVRERCGFVSERTGQNCS
jgi:hypothetical protein